jgi:glycosyltransferase involved in cell wall biosynthesis
MRRPGRPRVSVCVPVYNGSAYIGACLESVLAQTFDDFELIVCDNCSTDDTEEVVRRYADPRIRYVRNPQNLGLVGNANRCLALASGEYVCIFHHDDVMLPENLARKVACLDAHPDVGFVHSNILLIDQVGTLLATHSWAEDSWRDDVERGASLFRRFVMNMPSSSLIFIGAVLARKSAYDTVGGFSPELPHCNDGEMWMRMLLFFDVACIGEPLVQYRTHPSSTSGSWGAYDSFPYLREHHEAVRLVFERYATHIPDRRRLLNAVAKKFASRAVTMAWAELARGNAGSSRSMLAEAFRMSRRVACTRAFWGVLGGTFAGREGVRIYRKVKGLVKSA